MPSIAIAWFRRDLRLADHPALTAAIEAADIVVPVFVFDVPLLGGRFASATRTWFMRESVASLARDLEARGAGLRIATGRPLDVLPALARDTGATSVFVTRDAAPYGRRRDRAVAERLASDGVTMHAKRGLYVHEPDEVRTQDGRGFTVYSPFRRAWEAMPRRGVFPVPDRIPGDPSHTRSDPIPAVASPTADIALIPAPGEAAARERLDRWVVGRVEAYADSRNRIDAPDGTSRLSQDLRWGLLSPLEVVERAAGAGEGRRVFVGEIAWREFYAHVLWHHPGVLREPFQPAFAALEHARDDAALEAWAAGRTGYPVVDAAMRQLRASGYVHNRARMIAASFLTKDLLLDWRLGEAEFMRHLTDGDVASNNGGWQWTASTGTDPQPYFRIFNPILQGKRFDPDGAYVRRWVPELAAVPAARIHEPWTMTPLEQAESGIRIGVDYPAPIVDHAEARERALAAYSAARGDASPPSG
ncbi:MAG TPA: deoxyribodipyrimidine photo-lyase [Candidatus Limnocylindrales bacterium]|nr:deoxyribodipyrimidine photo-lyase [Candidatus Limnocylindrales bacterium]